ncbi:sensor histidine kinase [Caenimonas terrae]|uniref:histidine kinase n=1 Tax=Caenimonas terrae TaxID=696074 RepID=A0ABW0N8G8_9BURK
MANTISIPWAESTLELMGDTPFDRLWRGFMTARVTIALVLLGLLSTLYMMGGVLGISDWLVGLAATYLVATLAVRLLAKPQPPGSAFDPQWVSTIGVDLVAFSTLQLLQAGNINYSPLFALPVLMAAVLGSSLLALGTAAGVTLLLLAEAWVMVLQLPQELATRFLQAGLTGMGYFAVAVLVNQLAARLAREEAAARNSRQMARVQAQVNELVIENLGDGVLVVDADGRVRAANPAARKQLGSVATAGDQPLMLTAHAPWQPLAELARLTFTTELSQRADVAIDDGVGSPRRMQVRTRLTAAQDDLAHSLCVMFLQDLRELEARLRTEKLAAMGRMSAAVAHEIRNPLAAIAQANALLEEDLVDPGQRQLSALVRQNAQRLAGIVEEILNISRVQHQGPHSNAPRLALDESVTEACTDWARQSGVGERLQLSLAGGAVPVEFESDHLRRILINLLDNAQRYASKEPASIRVLTQRIGNESTLRVWSDGAPLEAAVRQHLFEPFFSSESRSSGLGLYICRELCERHGAQIGYRRSTGPGGAPRPGNEFFVVFRPQGPALAGNSPFDTIAA